MTAALTMPADEAATPAAVDTGLCALAIVARVHGVACEPDQMAYAQGAAQYEERRGLVFTAWVRLERSALQVEQG